MATQKNKAALITQFIAAIYPNTTQQIGAQIHQDAILDLLESIPFFLDNPEILEGLTEYVSGNTYNEGGVTVFEGKIYQANEDGITGAFDPSKWTSIPTNDALAEFAAWDNVTNYIIDDTVRHSNRLWKSLTANLASTPPDNPLDWVEVSPAESAGVVNPWVAGVYKENTLIVNADKLYYISPLVGNTLDSTDPATEITAGDWTLIASIGTGLTGMTQNVIQKSDATGADLEDSNIYDDGTSVVIGGTGSNAAAELKLQSVTKGFLKNKLTTTERNALTAPPKGLEVFNTTTNQPEVNTGTSGTPVWSSMTIASAQDLQSVLDTGASASISGAISLTSSAATITFLASTGLIMQGLTYPNADGLAGYVMTTDGAGNLALTLPELQNLQGVLSEGASGTVASAILIKTTAASATLQADDGAILTEFVAGATSATMRLNNTTNDKSIVFDATNMIVTDTISSTGLIYAADYSGNFTDNSLITKKWVTDQGYITSTDGNGIYTSDDTVGAGRVATITDTLQFATGKVIIDSLQYTDGSEGAGKVLQSDASGNATWATFSGDNIYSINGTLAAARTVTLNGNDLIFSTAGSNFTIDGTSGQGLFTSATAKLGVATTTFATDGLVNFSRSAASGVSGGLVSGEYDDGATSNTLYTLGQGVSGAAAEAGNLKMYATAVQKILISASPTTTNYIINELAVGAGSTGDLTGTDGNLRIIGYGGTSADLRGYAFASAANREIYRLGNGISGDQVRQGKFQLFDNVASTTDVFLTAIPSDKNYINNDLGIGFDSTSVGSIAAKLHINGDTRLDGRLELASTTQALLIMRMTAAQAAAITPANGMMLYATSTDATFTAVGFWGYEGGAWTKL